MEKFKLKPEQQKFIDECLQGFDVLYAGVHGSVLYGLDTPTSDVDVKVIYMPSKLDLLKGQAIKTHNKKCPEHDIEVELKSLPSFLKSLSVADTNCFDILHTPAQYILECKPMWNHLQTFRQDIYAKNMKGVIGYIKTHAKKYTNKIERFDEMRELLEQLSPYNYEVPIKNLPLMKMTEGKKYIKVVTKVSDHVQPFLEICGKKYDLGWSVSRIRSTLNSEIDRYGSRTLDGSSKGMDSKSLSHALRVLCQTKEVIQDRTITFPLKERDLVFRVKSNQMGIEEVLNTIDTYFDEVETTLAVSDLPDEVNMSRFYEELEGYYFGYEL